MMGNLRCWIFGHNWPASVPVPEEFTTNGDEFEVMSKCHSCGLTVTTTVEIRDEDEQGDDYDPGAAPLVP